MQRPAPERPAVLEGAGLWVYDAGRSHPPALAASGAAWPNASVPAVLSFVAHYATLTHPEVRKKIYFIEKKKKMSLIN